MAYFLTKDGRLRVSAVIACISNHRRCGYFNECDFRWDTQALIIDLKREISRGLYSPIQEPVVEDVIKELQRNLRQKDSYLQSLLWNDSHKSCLSKQDADGLAYYFKEFALESTENE